MKIKVLAAAAALILAPGIAMADGDVKKGEKVFKKCAACHTVDQGGKAKVGPNLFGIVGKKAGMMEGFKYGKLLTQAGEAGLVWDEATLHKYLDKKGTNTTLKAFIEEKGGKPSGKSKMVFVGLKKEKDRDNVIAYLNTLK